MEKAFDVKDLGNRIVGRLKKQGVGIADDLLSWTGESCMLVQSPIVKGIGGIVVGIKPVVIAEVAKALGQAVPQSAAIAIANMAQPSKA